MAKIPAGDGYVIETLENGYKMLHCPDDIPGQMGHGICAYAEVSLNEFRAKCKKWIAERKKYGPQKERLVELLLGMSLDTAEDREYVAKYLIDNGVTIK